jgi:hypothetical protein
MGQKFCTSCGAALRHDANFCENCGAPVKQDVPASTVSRKVIVVSAPREPEGEPTEEDAPASPDIPGVIPASSSSEPEGAPVPAPGAAPKFPAKVNAAIVIVLVIAAAAVFVVLPKLSGSPDVIAGQKSAVQTTAVPVTTSPQALTTTVVSPPPIENPFPDALALKQKFPFGSGDLASEGTVYRYWMNDTYQWHNDKDNRYYVEKPRAGYKFLAIFVDVANKGNNRIWPPTAENVHLIYDGEEYALDQDHYLPDKSINVKATPIEIKEIQYISKLTGIEYVEDYGYSHGTRLSYLYPGESNAIDGYLIYEVPKSLTADKAFVKIEFNAQEVGVWKLA